MSKNSVDSQYCEGIGCFENSGQMAAAAKVQEGYDILTQAMSNLQSTPMILINQCLAHIPIAVQTSKSIKQLQ